MSPNRCSHRRGNVCLFVCSLIGGAVILVMMCAVVLALQIYGIADHEGEYQQQQQQKGIRGLSGASHILSDITLEFAAKGSVINANMGAPMSVPRTGLDREAVSVPQHHAVAHRLALAGIYLSDRPIAADGPLLRGRDSGSGTAATTYAAVPLPATPLVPIQRLGNGVSMCPTAKISVNGRRHDAVVSLNTTALHESLGRAGHLMDRLRAYFAANLPSILQLFEEEQRRVARLNHETMPPQPYPFGHPLYRPAGKNKFGQIADGAIEFWVEKQLLSMIPVSSIGSSAGNSSSRGVHSGSGNIVDVLRAVFDAQSTENSMLGDVHGGGVGDDNGLFYPCVVPLCGPFTRMANPSVKVGLASDADDAIAKALRYVGSSRVLSLGAAGSGTLLQRAADCHRKVQTVGGSGGGGSDVTAAAAVPILATAFDSSSPHFPPDHLPNAQATVKGLASLVTESFTVAGGAQPSASAPPSFPLPAGEFSTRVTKFKQTAWIALHNVCGFCEARAEKRKEEGENEKVIGSSSSGENGGGAHGDGDGGEDLLSDPQHYKKGYMYKPLPCALSLYSVGPSTDDLHQLQAAKHSGRNDIYFQREAGFQYNGHVRAPEDLISIALGAAKTRREMKRRARSRASPPTPTPTVRFVNGTTVLASSFNVDNVGHVIQDALWGLEETLLIATEVNKRYYRNDTLLLLMHSEKKNRYIDSTGDRGGTSASTGLFEGVGGSISTLKRPPTALYKSKRKSMFASMDDELLYLFPRPTRVLLGNGFAQHSSRYYAELSLAMAMDAVGKSSVFRSPFDALEDDSSLSGSADGDVSAIGSSSDAIFCFETLLAGGADRELSKGHYNSFAGKEHVAEGIRRAAGAAADASAEGTVVVGAAETALSQRQPSPRDTVQVFVYGRNDVHRRSIDNIAALFTAVELATTSMASWYGGPSADGTLKGTEGTVEGTRPVFAAVNPLPTLISTFSLSPSQQVRLGAAIDIFVTIQGAHMQNSLFMAPDGVVIEIAPCGSSKVSFLKRYGLYMPSTQRHVFMQLCGASPALLKQADVAGIGGGGGVGPVADTPPSPTSPQRRRGSARVRGGGGGGPPPPSVGTATAKTASSSSSSMSSFPLAQPFPYSPAVWMEDEALGGGSIGGQLSSSQFTNPINFSENDMTNQNITLCPMWLLRIQQEVQRQVGLLVESRRQRRNAGLA